VLARLLRDPLTVFLLAGGLLFALYAALESRQQPAVVLDAATRQGLIEEFVSLIGREASPADIERLEREYISNELLLLDAISQGLHQRDRHIREQLIETLRLEVAGLLPEPGDEELVAHYAEHHARYRSEPSASFEHVYFSQRPEDAAALLAALERGEVVAGEEYDQGRSFPRYGRSILRGMFGVDFVEALWAAATGQWHGPWPSPRGWHFIRVSERFEPALLPFAAVRDQVASDWMVARIDQAVARHVEVLRQRHEVRIAR
jgi:peptidyl-prolyl cis-trans isomerase C